MCMGRLFCRQGSVEVVGGQQVLGEWGAVLMSFAAPPPSDQQVSSSQSGKHVLWDLAVSGAWLSILNLSIFFCPAEEDFKSLVTTHDGK